MNIEDVTFESGSVTLHGKLHIADPTLPTVLFLPGISGGSLSERFDYLGGIFNKAGFNFFRFNFRGQEEGQSVDTTCLEDELIDIKSALSFLEVRGININKFGLVAKSFGGLKGFLLNDSRLQAAAFLAPAAFFGNISNVEEIKTIPYSEIAHLSDITPSINVLKNWKVPTLLIHGGSDNRVELKNSEKIFEHLTSEKVFKVIPNAGHSLDEDETQRQLVSDYLTTFFKENFVI